MPFGAPCHYARHYARAGGGTSQAKGDFRRVPGFGGTRFGSLSTAPARSYNRRCE